MSSNQLTFDFNVDNKQAIDSINAFFQVYEKGVAGMGKMLNDAVGGQVEKKVMLTMENGEVVAKEVQKIDKDVQKIADAAKAMNGEFGKTPNALKSQLRVMKELQGNIKKYADDGKTVTAEWKKIEKVIDSLNRKLKDMGNHGLGGLEGKLVDAAITAEALERGFGMITGAMRELIMTGADMEVLFIQLKGFTGSTEEASAAYQRFIEIGQATPFTAKEVAEGAKVMMGFGLSASEAGDQVERLAIVASATGGELKHMARNLGQIKANQRAYTRDLMQFANQGIPIYKMLSETMGVTSEQVRQFAEDGKIGYGEVKVALMELTREGSAYRQIAEEMDATLSAKLEALTSSVQTFAGRFVEAFNAIDAAMGGVVSGGLQLVISGFNELGKGLEWVKANAAALAPVIAGLTVAMGTLLTVAVVTNWTQLSAALSGLAIVKTLLTAKEWALATAMAVTNALAGNWVAIAAAGAAAAGIAAIAVANQAGEQESLNQSLSESGSRWSENKQGIDETAFSLTNLTGKYRDIVKAQKEVYDDKKAKFEAEVDAIKRTHEAINERYEGEKEKIKEVQEQLKEAYEAEKAVLEDKRDRTREYYSEVLDNLNKEKSALQEKHEMELGIINAKTREEVQLQNLRRKELQLKIQSGKLNEKELLEAKVRLQQMDRAKKLEEARKRQKLEMKKIEDQIKTTQDQQKEALKEIANEIKNLTQEYKRKHDDEKEKIDEINAKQKEAQELYEQFMNRNKEVMTENHETMMQQLSDQIDRAKDLEIAMRNAYSQAKQANEEASKNGGTINGNAGAQADAASKNISWYNLGGALASGGPAKGGTDYIVNELGQEAFLSASGRLSKINAPSWGRWRAPSNGTVIPAHLTKQLDIPAGGVNINRAASMNAAGVPTNGGLIAAVRGLAAGGDNIMNNVTVQSNNPSKTASDMLVSLTKIRRRRLR
jgi:tape measure domain-containing protein